MEPTKRIKTLLDKYWLAETTAQEEAELRHYFKDIHADEDEVAALFHYFDNEKKTGVSQSLDESFRQRIYADRPVRIWQLPLFKAAAILLLILSTVFIIKLNQSEKKGVQYVDTYQDPQDALKEAKNSLLLVSEKLNKGKQYTLELKQMNKAQQLLK